MFYARRGTLNIEFKLAKTDPNGGCTTGVIFHSKQSGFGNGGGYDTVVQADAWDNYKYMNVYIQNDLYVLVYMLIYIVYAHDGIPCMPILLQNSSTHTRVTLVHIYNSKTLCRI